MSDFIATLKPEPTSPTTADSGSSQSVKVSSASLIASVAIVVSTRVTSKPGMPFSSKKAVMPPRARFTGSVTAITMMTSATWPPLM